MARAGLPHDHAHTVAELQADQVTMETRSPRTPTATV